jgi:signal transduction histidine kinase
VRYVSHEIRTPLNAACLGLSLLEKEIDKCFAALPNPSTMLDSSKESLVEIVADVSQACNIAVEIMNDLLMYEKIEGGLMQLETKETLLPKFVQESVKIFQVQVRKSSKFKMNSE